MANVHDNACEQAGARRTIWLLFGCQALTATVGFVQAATGSLVGYSLAPTKALSTVPQATIMLAAMSASVLAIAVFERLGRQAGFLLAALFSTAGCLLHALGLSQGSFTLFCLGAVPAGLGLGLMQHLRFAAAEAAPVQGRARAITLVMAGGVPAALLGPELIKYTQALSGPVPFLGTYLVLAALPVLAALVLIFVNLPSIARPQVLQAPVRAIVLRPAFAAAALAGIAAQGSMHLVMASSPVQVVMCGFGVDAGANIARFHALAMFAPGILTGRLIERFGAGSVICTGGILCLACAALSVSSMTYLSFSGAVILLGLGWNLMFTGATALLERAHTSTERVRAQAANDALVSGATACAAFSSGALHGTAGWRMLNGAAVLLILVGLGAVLWRRVGRTRVAVV